MWSSSFIVFLHSLELMMDRTTPRSGPRGALSSLSRVNKKEPLREKRLLDGPDHVAGWSFRRERLRDCLAAQCRSATGTCRSVATRREPYRPTRGPESRKAPGMPEHPVRKHIHRTHGSHSSAEHGSRSRAHSPVSGPT